MSGANSTNSPYIEHFIRWMKDGAQFGQVWVGPRDRGFELRHFRDASVAQEALRDIPLAELREWVREDAAGRFRPLSGAPDLKTGWRAIARSAPELEQALDSVYPGALVDWFHSTSGLPPVTNFPEYAARQTGIYRQVSTLVPGTVHSLVGACCDPRLCLKRRLWAGTGLDPEDAAGKSVIPCLEPCAVLLEFARRCGRIEQEPRTAVELSAADWTSVIAGLEAGLRDASNRADLRIGEVGDPLNPRRLLRVLGLVKSQLPGEPAPAPGPRE